MDYSSFNYVSSSDMPSPTTDVWICNIIIKCNYPFWYSAIFDIFSHVLMIVLYFFSPRSIREYRKEESVLSVLGWFIMLAYLGMWNIELHLSCCSHKWALVNLTKTLVQSYKEEKAWVPLFIRQCKEMRSQFISGLFVLFLSPSRRPRYVCSLAYFSI